MVTHDDTNVKNAIMICDSTSTQCRETYRLYETNKNRGIVDIATSKGIVTARRFIYILVDTKISDSYNS